MLNLFENLKLYQEAGGDDAKSLKMLHKEYC